MQQTGSAGAPRRWIVNNRLHRETQWPLRLGTWLAVVAIGVGCCRADDASPPGNSASQPSFFQSLSSMMGGGDKRTLEATAPKPAASPSDDPVSLQGKGKPDVKLYVALAHLAEEKGQLAEAQQQYKLGLEESPDDLRALLGYARLKDRLGEPNAAMKFYQRAIKAQPKEAAVYNNLAIHYATQSMYRESLAAFQRAIGLRPKEIRYRNNVATVLVQLNRPQDAFVQLCAVHERATAHYNLGVLMAKNGQPQPAAEQFSIALQWNPSLLPARQWLEHLGDDAVNILPTDGGRRASRSRPQRPRLGPIAPSHRTKQRGDRLQPGADIANLAAPARDIAVRGVAGDRRAQRRPQLPAATAGEASALAGCRGCERLPLVSGEQTTTWGSPRNVDSPGDHAVVPPAPLPPTGP